MYSESKNMKNLIYHYGTMFLGSAIISFGVFNVHSQSGITEGGVLGMILLVNHWFGISPSIVSPVLDFCCYVLGRKVLGAGFLKNAIFASLATAGWYRVWESAGYLLPDLSSQPLIASVLGALFIGIGVGLVVRKGGACSGDDALALVIEKVSGWRISRAYMITDFTVLFLSLSYIPLSRIAYSLLTVTLSSNILEWVKEFGKE